MELRNFKNYLREYQNIIFKQISETEKRANDLLVSINRFEDQDVTVFVEDITDWKEFLKSHHLDDIMCYSHLKRQVGYLYDKNECLKELYYFLITLNSSFSTQTVMNPIDNLEGLFFVCNKALKDGAIDIETANQIIGSVIYINSKNPDLCSYDMTMIRTVFQIRHFYNAQGEFLVFLEAKYLEDLYNCLIRQFEEHEEYEYMIQGFCDIYGEGFEEYIEKHESKSKAIDFEEYKRTRIKLINSEYNEKSIKKLENE